MLLFYFNTIQRASSFPYMNQNKQMLDKIDGLYWHQLESLVLALLLDSVNPKMENYRIIIDYFIKYGFNW
jgi:hypothetical protein